MSLQEDRAPILNKDTENEAARVLVLINVEFLHQPRGLFCLLIHLFNLFIKDIIWCLRRPGTG